MGKDIELLSNFSAYQKGQIKKQIGGTKLADLFYFLPNSFDQWIFSSQLLSSFVSKKVSLIATIEDHVPPTYHRSFYAVKCSVAGASLTLIYFRAYRATLLKKLPLGSTKLICGTLEKTDFGYQIIHPVYVGPTFEQKYWNGYLPNYSAGKGLSSFSFYKIFSQLLKNRTPFAEWLPDKVHQKNNWPSFWESIRLVHQPRTNVEFTGLMPLAKERLAFDERLFFYTSLFKQRSQEQKKVASVFQPLEQENLLKKNLGFTLTSCQESVLHEIFQDLGSGFQMKRLLQGDVGSGKTAVAFLALMRAVLNGYQGAIFVPTEILARQHFQTFSQWLAPFSISTDLLTAASLGQGKLRREKLEDLATGKTNLVIGTHALIEKAVQFKNLGMLVIDEQHRFGVEQRLKLAKKSQSPHLLVMTATPIPRSLVWANSGLVSVSRLNQKPVGRKPIDTRLICLHKIESVYQGLARALEKGGKIFWVCPLIQTSDKLDLGAAESRYHALASRFPNRISFVHGQMDPDARSERFERFRKEKSHILVATTVIEVGCDVPDATIMVIENAERFGLAQLHQLRGRVGRSDQAAFCLLLYGEKTSPDALKKLYVIRDHQDGLKIAQSDLKIRGGGDLFGIKQSGFAHFKLEDPWEHRETTLTDLAADTAEELLRSEQNKIKTKTLEELFRLSFF